MMSIKSLWVQCFCGASATIGHCPNGQLVGVAYAADVRDSRPLGHEYFVSRVTNEARAILNHLRIYGDWQLLADAWNSAICF